MLKYDGGIKVVEAIQADDVDLLQELYVAETFHINTELFNQETPLGFAIRHQSLNAVKLLLNAQADVGIPSLASPLNPYKNEDPNSKKIYPLQIAINTRNLEIIELVLNRGPSLKYFNRGVHTLLSLAVQLKAYSLTEKVIEIARDEDMCRVSSLDLSEPLRAAVTQQDSKMVKMLIQLGANVNREHDHMVPIVVAANNLDLRMCVFLLNNGANLNNTGGLLGMAQTPLSYAIRASMVNAVSMLLKLGSDANAVVDWSTRGSGSTVSLLAGSSMLHFAVAKQQLSTVRQLVAAGAKVGQADSEGNIPLHLACQLAGDRTDIVKYLVNIQQQQFDQKHLKNATTPLDCINTQNKKGLTPLMVAIQEKNEEVIKVLLEAQPCLNFCDRRQKTALHTAVDSDFKNGVLLLLKAGCSVDGGVTKGHKYTPLHVAVKENNITLANILLEEGANPNLLTPAKETVLHLSVMARSEYFTKLFLARGLDVNYQTSSRETPLMLGVRQDNMGVCRVLLENGAQLDCVDKNKETALSLSVYFGFEANARLLIANGADINKADKRKTTPLYWSIFNCRLSTLKLLLLAGAKFTLKDLYRYPKNLSVMKNKDLVNWMVDTLKCLPSLQDLCRKKVRSTLIKASRHTAIQTRVDSLPIPTRLQQYLMYDTTELGTDGVDP